MRKQPGENSNCWMITKKQVGHVSKKTIKDSIDSLCQYSSDELKIEFQKRIENAHQNSNKRQKQIAAKNMFFYHNSLLMLCLLFLNWMSLMGIMKRRQEYRQKITLRAAVWKK